MQLHGDSARLTGGSGGWETLVIQVLRGPPGPDALTHAAATPSCAVTLGRADREVPVDVEKRNRWAGCV